MDANDETAFCDVDEYANDGPQANNYVPPRRDRSQGEIGIRGRNNGQRREGWNNMGARELLLRYSTDGELTPISLKFCPSSLLHYDTWTRVQT
ncbi:hypothetical protein F2P79_017720 [Pimephales promelas]|nr:hypothetical protein F2P79_017720 [Pimephales promelas]